MMGIQPTRALRAATSMRVLLAALALAACNGDAKPENQTMKLRDAAVGHPDAAESGGAGGTTGMKRDGGDAMRPPDARGNDARVAGGAPSSGGSTHRDASMESGGSGGSGGAGGASGPDSGRGGSTSPPSEGVECLLTELRRDAAAGALSMPVSSLGCYSGSGGFCCDPSAMTPCAPVELDITSTDASSPGLVVADGGSDTERITLRGVFTTNAPLPLTPPPIPTPCVLSANSANGNSQDIEVAISYSPGTKIRVSVTGWEPSDVELGGRTECFLRMATEFIPALDGVIDDYVRKDLCGRCACH